MAERTNLGVLSRAVITEGRSFSHFTLLTALKKLKTSLMVAGWEILETRKPPSIGIIYSRQLGIRTFWQHSIFDVVKMRSVVNHVLLFRSFKR